MHSSPKFSAGRHNGAFLKNLLTQDQAEEIAITALHHIGVDQDRLDRFLSLTGLDADGLRRAAAEPGFLAAVLDHLAGHEPDLMAFANATKTPPENIEAARQMLGGAVLGD